MPFGVARALFSAAFWPLSVAMGKLSSTLHMEQIDGELDPAPHADEQVLAALLTHFEKPGMSPPSARIRSVVLAQQRQAEGTLVVLRGLRLGAALASKGMHNLSTLACSSPCIEYVLGMCTRR